MQNHYFSLKIHRFSTYHPYAGFVVWCSNSLDETATPLCILDRGVDFWGPKSKIFECMQRNRHSFWNLTNVSSKIITFLWQSIDSQACTRIQDPWSDVRILLTKRPLHVWSSIGVSISEAPMAEFSKVCSEIVTFSDNWGIYPAKSLLFYKNPWILKLAPLSRIRDLMFEFSRRNGYSITHPR